MFVLALAASAGAAPVTWYLSGVTMADGAVANGSFVFDASTNTYSSVSITTSGGSVFVSSTYTAVDPNAVSVDDGTNVELVPNAGLANFTGTPVLVLFFQTTLTDAGGSSWLAGGPASYETTCRDSACTGPSLTRRNFLGGIATTTPPPTSVVVPTLSSFSLAILAVLLAGSTTLMLRRKAARPF